MPEKPAPVRPMPLVLRTGVPLMISLLINSLYNFVDSVFVSRISEEALTALSLAAPVQILMSAMGLGIAVGLNAVILHIKLLFLFFIDYAQIPTAHSVSLLQYIWSLLGFKFKPLLQVLRLIKSKYMVNGSL